MTDNHEVEIQVAKQCHERDNMRKLSPSSAAVSLLWLDLKNSSSSSPLSYQAHQRARKGDTAPDISLSKQAWSGCLEVDTNEPYMIVQVPDGSQRMDIEMLDIRQSGMSNG